MREEDVAAGAGKGAGGGAAGGKERGATAEGDGAIGDDGDRAALEGAVSVNGGATAAAASAFDVDGARGKVIKEDVATNACIGKSSRLDIDLAIREGNAGVSKHEDLTTQGRAGSPDGGAARVSGDGDGARRGHEDDVAAGGARDSAV